MTQKPRSTPSHLTISAMVALAVLALPLAALANTTADTTILNVVQVDYSDAGGVTAFTATASSIVTVNLVASPLLASGPPTATAGDEGGAALQCPDTSANQIASGTTFESLFALTATANGDDTYNLAMANTPTNTDPVTVSHQYYTYNGVDGFTLLATDPPNQVLGAAVVVGFTDTDTLLFPGGSLDGFAVNDIAVIDGVAYVVAAVTTGSAAEHTNAGGAPAHSDEGTTVPETQGSLTLAALPVTDIIINGANVAVGSNTAPAFDSNDPTGLLIGEMVLVKISVTASATATTGSVAYTLTATDSDDGVGTIACTVEFEGVGLTIRKDVRNFTLNPTGAFGAAATGNPGDVLEYQVTVANTTGGIATEVVVTDAVPAYTTLVAGAYDTGNAFAVITDNASNEVNVTTATDSEIQPLDPVETGFGVATGTAAGSDLTFFLGNTATNALGGTLPYCSDDTSLTATACTTADPAGTWIDTLTIIYRVTID